MFMDSLRSFLVLALLAASSACTQRMSDQPRYEYLDRSSFFSDGRSARPLEYGVVPRGSLTQQASFLPPDGKTFSDTLPLPVTSTLLHRGKQRYEIYCSPCHGLTGYGDGMIARRGLAPPPSLHDERSRALPTGYVYAVITNGFGAMSPYSYQITPADRWAIIAYVRTLQFSQNRSLSDLRPEERTSMEEQAR